MEAPVCNEDCLHCIYPDCILETLILTARKELKLLDLEIIAPLTQRQKDYRESRRAYYEWNKAWILLQHQRYYMENREKVLAQRHAHYQAHKEEVLESQHTYYQAHKEEAKAQHRAYREANREKVLAQKRKEIAERNRAYRAANHEKVREREQAYYYTHREECLARGKARLERRRQQKKEDAANLPLIQEKSGLNQPPESGMFPSRLLLNIAATHPPVCSCIR